MVSSEQKECKKERRGGPEHSLKPQCQASGSGNVAGGVCVFPFTGCQSIKTQATAVRPVSQHRKEQELATEPPFALQPSLISIMMNSP